jgi:hypothetical protein
LAEIAHRFGRKALEELAAVAKPDTLLAWYRKLIANKFDGSKFRKLWLPDYLAPCRVRAYSDEDNQCSGLIVISITIRQGHGSGPQRENVTSHPKD